MTQPRSTPTVETLKQHIRRAERELLFHKAAGGGGEDLALLFTGNAHDAIPRNLILNQTLSPVEKVTWQALRLSIGSPQNPGSTPKRDELALMVNCSPPTISTARQMLRLCRYTTLCSVVRERGMFVGEIYLLHDEAMDIATTLQIDPTYLEFVQSLAGSGNRSARVRKEAGLILRELQEHEIPTAPQSMSDRMAMRLADGYSGYARAREAPAPTASARDPRTADRAAAPPSSVQQQHAFDQSKKFALVKDSQSKNFTLDQKTDSQGGFQQIRRENSQNHQSKNFTLDEKLTKSNQSKFFASAVRSSNRSSSYINIFNTAHAREEESLGSPAAPAMMPSFADWESEALNSNRFQVERFPRHDAGEVVRDSDTRGRGPSGTAPDPDIERRVENLRQHHPPLQRDFFPEDHELLSRYQPLDLGAEVDAGDEFNALIRRFLPEIGHPSLERYISVGFFEIQNQVPMVSHILKPLPGRARRDVLVQYLARRAGYLHGWCEDDIANPVGYIKTLVGNLKKGTFALDSFAAEMIRAMTMNEAPWIQDSVDKRMKLREDEELAMELWRTKSRDLWSQ
jgi:hypothetical protein